MEAHHAGAESAASGRASVFDKMEMLVREMQDPEHGVPVRSQKLFLTSIPSAFMGYDLIEWLMERLNIEDSAEALHLSNLLCQYGYYFPVNDCRNLIVKDDSSLYRFQTPYYWPSQSHNPDNTEYAIYLHKRSQRNKQKHGLEEYELEMLNKLKKSMSNKWDFIHMQAEEQVRLSKDRKKGDKIVTDSQEKAYWRVYRPPPGCLNTIEAPPVPCKRDSKVRKKTKDDVKKDVRFLSSQLIRTRMKVSQALESITGHCSVYNEYDPFLAPPQPSNPWLTDDNTFWVINSDVVEIPTEKRARRWAFSMEELVSDPTGIQEFTNYLRKEYSHENIRFWQAVNSLRTGPQSKISKRVHEIFEEFLAPGAPCEINIDGKTMERTQELMKTPTRFTFDLAAEHVYTLLLKKDCYPRFVRSDNYKTILANALQPSSKKRFFSFGGAVKKKISTVAAPTAAPSSAIVPYVPVIPPLRRRGSEKSLTGSASDMPATGPEVRMGQSHSTTNLAEVDCEIPYRDASSGKVAGEGDDVCPWESVEPPEKETICPWETMELPTTKKQESGESDICPWEGSEPPKKTTTSEGGGGLKKALSTQSDKVDISVCPWEAAEDLPKKQNSQEKQQVCPWESDAAVVSLPKKEEADPPPADVVCPWETEKLPPPPDVDAICPWEASDIPEVPLPPIVTEDEVCPPIEPPPPWNTASDSIILETEIKTNDKCSAKSEPAVSKTFFSSITIQVSDSTLTPKTFVSESARKKPIVTTSVESKPANVHEPKETMEPTPVEAGTTAKSTAESVRAAAEPKPTEKRSGPEPKPSEVATCSSETSAVTLPEVKPTENKALPEPKPLKIRSASEPKPIAEAKAPSEQKALKIRTVSEPKPSEGKSTTAESKPTKAKTAVPEPKPAEEKPSSEHQKPPVKSKSISEATKASTSSGDDTVKSAQVRSDERRDSSVVAPWEGQEKKVAEICPWEDEENCKVDTPFVKTYATLGYL